MSDLSRVEDLAQRVADGLVEEAEFAELEGLMKEDRESRILYLKTQQIHQDLERKSARGTLGSEATGEIHPFEFPLDPVEAKDPKVQPTRPSRPKWRGAGIGAAAAIAIMALPAIKGLLFGFPPTAIITRLDKVDENWAYHQPIEVGDRIAFDSGVMEITYKKGTRVVLQGPVDYTLEEDGLGRLDLGALAAEVPPAASGFTVKTSSAEVTDIGTRFAVAQLDTGRTEFAVFEGEVRAQGLAPDSETKSFIEGQAATVDDGEKQVRSVSIRQVRCSTIGAELDQLTFEATADRFVQGGEHADVVPIDSPNMLLVKRVGSHMTVARKVCMRFDLSGQKVDRNRPATLTLHTSKDISPTDWDIELYGLLEGFKPTGGSQDIDWSERSLTWNNAPGNDTSSPTAFGKSVKFITTTRVNVDRVSKPAGSFFTFNIRSLKPFLQPDGTVTLILSTSSGRHQVLNFASRENKTFPGPLLTIQSSGRDLN